MNIMVILVKKTTVACLVALLSSGGIIEGPCLHPSMFKYQNTDMSHASLGSAHEELIGNIKVP